LALYKLSGVQKSAVTRLLPILLLSLSACGFGSQPSASSVTVKLPPPKQAVAPGFGRDFANAAPATD
jgi:hypothetical protein